MRHAVNFFIAAAAVFVFVVGPVIVMAEAGRGPAPDKGAVYLLSTDKSISVRVLEVKNGFATYVYLKSDDYKLRIDKDQYRVFNLMFNPIGGKPETNWAWISVLLFGLSWMFALFAAVVLCTQIVIGRLSVEDGGRNHDRF